MKAVRNTQQKELVKEIVIEACDHPTADMIYERAQNKLPNISLGTVYRILRQLTDENVIVEIPVNDAPSRFDKTLVSHSHFVCDKCGKVEDIWFNIQDVISDINFNGNEIKTSQVLFKGTCDKCK